MKKIFLYITLAALLSCSSTKNKFNKGVKLIEISTNEGFKTPKSILFEFSDSGHLANYYIDLSEQLIKTISLKDIKIGRNFNFTQPEIFISNIKEIPKNKDRKDDFDITCKVSTLFSETPKRWKYYKSINYRKTQHILIFDFFDKNQNKILHCKLDIHAYCTIATETKKTAKILSDLITKQSPSSSIKN